MHAVLTPWRPLFPCEPLVAREPAALREPAAVREPVAAPEADLDLDADDGDLVQDPNKPRGWLVSEKGLETIFRPDLGAFEDVPARKRPKRAVGQLFS
jgi:hypothetical protein